MEKLYNIYRNCKTKQGNEIVILVRGYGGYYLFDNDATKAHKATGLLCVHLNIDNKDVKMTLFDYSELDTYLPKLIRAGYRVAICG